jgi:hypothetical protein
MVLNDVKKFASALKVPVLIAIAATALLYWLGVQEQKQIQAMEQRKEVVCPSFLSIARSSRDTLIVMRNEPLCNSYVLDNLQ